MGRAPDKPFSYKYFGDELIISQDLDPVYTALVGADLDDDLLKRTLLAYCCYYSLGTAARIAEPSSDKFYDTMWQAHAGKWQHGFERRYFYGEQAENSIRHLQSRGSAERIVDHMMAHATFGDVSDAVQSYVGFGPWMSFKIADMGSCVIGYDIDFSDCELSMYKDPVQGCALMYYGDKKHSIEPNEIRDVVGWMIEDFSEHRAPPRFDRPVNLQEIETILCKFKAFYYGHYYPGKDTKEIMEGLEHAHELGCDLAQELFEHMPPKYVPSCDPYAFLGDGYHPNVCGLDYV